MSNHGIDYGMGTTNIDHESGIRYGVIHSGEVCQAWSDSSEPDYGEPHCPKCGNKALDSGHCDVPDFDDPENNDIEVSGCGECYCDSCRYAFDGDEAFGEEARAFTLDDGEYKAQQSGDDCDIFILDSPYYTHAKFCSPCAPGACYLMNPTDESGPKAYCFGHDWFDEDKAPYTVYRVSDGSIVNPE